VTVAVKLGEHELIARSDGGDAPRCCGQAGIDSCWQARLWVLAPMARLRWAVILELEIADRAKE
jgi:hypothetical protein